MKNALLVLALGAGLTLLGLRCFMDVRLALATGVGHFFLKWPNDISREDRPAAFWWTVVIHAAVGCMSFVIAFVSLLSIFFRHC